MNDSRKNGIECRAQSSAYLRVNARTFYHATETENSQGGPANQCNYKAGIHRCCHRGFLLHDCLPYPATSSLWLPPLPTLLSVPALQHTTSTQSRLRSRRCPLQEAHLLPLLLKAPLKRQSSPGICMAPNKSTTDRTEDENPPAGALLLLVSSRHRQEEQAGCTLL